MSFPVDLADRARPRSLHLEKVDHAEIVQSTGAVSCRTSLALPIPQKVSVFAFSRVH